MQPVKFSQKGEILLGGFHVGSDIDKRWDKFGQEEEKAKLTNIVDGTGFERRIYSSNVIDIFTGVEVTDKYILPNYELLVIPAAPYVVFEVNCNNGNDDIDRQFTEIDVWLTDNKNQYGQVKWANSDATYRIIWSGRYEKEMICEMWIPVLRFCQSCAMPMTKPEDYGTESDGNPSDDYCCHCYQNGDFTWGTTLEEAARENIQFWRKDGDTSDDEARARIWEVFPKLKRWTK